MQGKVWKMKHASWQELCSLGFIKVMFFGGRSGSTNRSIIKEEDARK
jgi:hypothetical protein